MPEDELEHLRAMLARAHDLPRRLIGVRAIFRRIAKVFFMRPKKAIGKQVQKDPPRKNAA